MFWQRALGGTFPRCALLKSQGNAPRDCSQSRAAAALRSLRPGPRSSRASFPASAAADRQRPPRPVGGQRPRCPPGAAPELAPLPPLRPPGPSAARPPLPLLPQRRRDVGALPARHTLPQSLPSSRAARSPQAQGAAHRGSLAAAQPGRGRARPGSRCAGLGLTYCGRREGGGGVTASQPRLCMSK